MREKDAVVPEDVIIPVPLDLSEMARRYSAALTRFLSRRMDNGAQVQDVVQDVFLRMLKTRDLSHVADPERYLFRSAINALHDHRRRDRARAAVEGGGASWLEGMAPPLPDHLLIGRETITLLDQAIRALPEKFRTVFVMRAIDGMRCADIATQTGVSKRAVEKRYAKALLAVRKYMANPHDDA